MAWFGKMHLILKHDLMGGGESIALLIQIKENRLDKVLLTSQ